MKKNYDVFISHKTTEDGAIANRLVACLESRGLKCWIAPRDIPASKNYASAIVDGIERSSVFLMLFSRYANESKDIVREVHQASSFQIPILTVRLDNTKFSPDLGYFLSLPQGIGPFGRNESVFDGVFNNVKALLDGTRTTAHVPMPVRRKKRRVVTIGLALIGMLGLFGAFKLPDYRKAVTSRAIVAFNGENWETGYKLATSPFADKNNATILHNIGIMYSNGRVLPRDDAKAVEYFTKSAEKGEPCAQCSLGVMYESGRGVRTADPELAYYWYRRAALQGHAEAQYLLAVCYENGRGIERDLKKARDWYGKAAESGNAKAAIALERLEMNSVDASGPFPSTRAEVQTVNEVLRVVGNLATAYQCAAQARIDFMNDAINSVGVPSGAEADVPLLRKRLNDAIDILGKTRPSEEEISQLADTPLDATVYRALFESSRMEIEEDLKTLPKTIPFYLRTDNSLPLKDRKACLQKNIKWMELQSQFFALGIMELLQPVSPEAMREFRKLTVTFTAIPRLAAAWPPDKDSLDIEQEAVMQQLQAITMELATLVGNQNMDYSAERRKLEETLREAGASPDEIAEILGNIKADAAKNTEETRNGNPSD